MNRLSNDKRAQILTCLNEGSSIRSTVRMTGAAKATILRLLADAGEFCSIYQDYRLQGLDCERIEADEIWSFVGAKQRNAKHGGQGDIWTFTAIDPDTKLMVSWLVGDRGQESANAFMRDLAARVAGRIELNTDGHTMYITAIRRAFGHRIDYAQLVKTFGQDASLADRRRYSPPVCNGAKKARVIGSPDMARVSTSIVERSNLSMRTTMRRFTRLTNAFSKKAENHAHAVSLGFMVYNFCRPHGTLTKRLGQKTTPAMAAGLEDRPWTMLDVAERMDADYRIAA